MYLLGILLQLILSKELLQVIDDQVPAMINCAETSDLHKIPEKTRIIVRKHPLLTQILVCQKSIRAKRTHLPEFPGWQKARAPPKERPCKTNY